MRQLTFTVLLLVLSLSLYAQFEYDPSKAYPFGRPNPEAPEAIKDFHPLIGNCECEYTIRNQAGEWSDTLKMQWRFKYIMNGMGVQDETLKEDGKHSGSIRQFIADSSRWYVHYYSSSGPTPVLSAWEGNKTEEGKIILYREQKAPNGMDGFYKITFSDISNEGFNWLGEWVNTGETFSYPTWKISCRKAGVD